VYRNLSCITHSCLFIKIVFEHENISQGSWVSIHNYLSYYFVVWFCYNCDFVYSCICSDFLDVACAAQPGLNSQYIFEQISPCKHLVIPRLILIIRLFSALIFWYHVFFMHWPLLFFFFHTQPIGLTDTFFRCVLLHCCIGLFLIHPLLPCMQPYQRQGKLYFFFFISLTGCQCTDWIFCRRLLVIGFK